jgi:hypothetical protein
MREGDKSATSALIELRLVEGICDMVVPWSSVGISARKPPSVNSVSAPARLSLRAKELAEHTAMQLICLDHLQWLRSGRDVAEMLHCSQSCVSRQSRSCLQLFGLRSRKSKGEFWIDGDVRLLREARRLHQLFRMAGFAEIRVEAPDNLVEYVGSAFEERGLAISCTKPRDCSGFIRLLCERVVDIWITTVPPEVGEIDSGTDSATRLISLAIDSGLPGLEEGPTLYLVTLPEVVGSQGFQSVLALLS